MFPQGSPRVSLEGFTVRATPRDPELGRAPQVHVHLSKRDYPCEGVDPFSPLRLPEHIQVLLRDIDSSLLHRASGHLEFDLQAGTHRFPLAGRHHFLVEVSEGTKGYARFQAGETPAPLAEPAVLARMLGPGPGDATTRENRRVVRALELTFSPPLLLPNVIPTLLEVQELIHDHGLAGWVKSPVLGGTARVAQTVGTDRFLELVDLLTNSANRLGFVLLRHVRAEPVFRPRRGIWELRPSFSGHVQLAGGVPLIPFTDVVLPAAVLPVPFASLDDLLSDNPLASADLHVERVRIDEAIEGMRGLLKRARGTFTLRAEVPKLLVQSELVDRTELRMSASLPSEVTVSGRVSAQLSGDTLIADAERIEIGFPESTVHLGVRALIEDLGPEAGGWTSRLRAHLENTVEPGSVIPHVELEVTTRHPQATGDSTLTLSLRNLEIDGGSGGISLAGPNIDLWPMSHRVGFKCDVSTHHDMIVREVGLRSEVQVSQGSFGGALELGLDGLWHWDLEGQAGVALRVVKAVPHIPELSIDEGELEARVEGNVRVRAAADASFEVTNAFDVELREGRVQTQLTVAELRLHDRKVAFPSPMRVEVSSRQAAISASGHGDLAIDVAWDMDGKPALLHAGAESASLLAPDLRDGELTVHLSAEGRLWFSGERQGLYGIRYFNTLLNPAADPEQLVELLRSEEALGHVFSALELISPELADKASLLRDVVLGLRNLAERAGIRYLWQFIPRPAIARMMSLALAGDDSLAPRIAHQVKAATEARGLDIIEVKNILRPYLDPFDVDYEVDRIVRWLAGLVEPIGPFPAEPPREAVPLALDPAYANELEGLPSAGELYARVRSGDGSEELSMLLCRLAPRLTEEQLGWVLANAPDGFRAEHVKWLRFVHAVKRRVGRIAGAYGGIEYALQQFVIATFLGEAVADGSDPALAPDTAWETATRWPPACALGADDVATLLKAGLALDRQDRQTQINNRMLLDILVRRPGRFTLDVFAELGQDNPHALSGVLFALLEQEQDHMLAPLDLPALLQKKLGMAVPRRRDFMAGGCRARDSYFGALSELADAVMARAAPSHAVKTHLQVQRHPVAAGYRPRPRAKTAIQAAKLAIAAADAQGELCRFEGRKPSGPVKAAMARYREAFSACAEVLDHDALAFQAPWFKAFWARNAEALNVLSVVRNYQHDVDRVRAWLHRRTGRQQFAQEQELLLAVIDTLIHDARDRETLRRDPLVRLLIDPEPGHYNFSVVSAMGVITEGEQGTELEDAFARLWDQRGVRVLRAPTGTAMSLEENARRIISTIEQVDGPYGLIGYSQGCANALAAESLLRGGTPDQQRMIQRLVCRNLLCSAFNGSAHGTFGSQKFLRAMVDGEQLLKHYQVMFSSEAVASFLRITRAVVDSPVFVRVLGGVHSLTPRRAADLHREMQLVEHAATSSMRGVASPDNIPETLEFTYYLLKYMTDGGEQDTQVLASDALGRSTLTINEVTRLLERCDMPSMRQRTHHWSPLKKETEFVTTERDGAWCVYDSPKDRHIFPWIEANARFGRIRRK